MPSTPNKTQRQLDLIAFLVARRFPVPREEIWDGVEGYAQQVRDGAKDESIRRTFERDKKDLLDMGFPLETVQQPVAESGESQLYRLSPRNFYLPYLRLLQADDEDGQIPKKSDTPAASIAPERAWIVAEALSVLRENPSLPAADAADSAFRKLTFDLHEPASHFGTAPLIVTADDDETRARVDELNRAIRERRVVRFRYHSLGRDQVLDREVAPWSLLYKYNRWYLIGHDRMREARRTFRVSRMSDLAIDDAPAPHFEPARMDMTEWHAASAWNLPGDDSREVQVEVRFEFPRSLWAARNELGELVLEMEGGAAVRRFSVRAADPFLRWLLSLQEEVSVVSPSDLAEALDALRAQVARMYSKTGARG